MSNKLNSDDSPRYIRCYDSEEDTFDRWTVVFARCRTRCGEFPTVGLSGHSSRSDHPADTYPKEGRRRPPAMGRRCHLGKRVAFTLLPPELRKQVMQEYCYIWDLSKP